MNAEECPTEPQIQPVNFKRLTENKAEELEHVNKRWLALNAADSFICLNQTQFASLDAEDISASLFWGEWNKCYFIDFDYLPHDKVMQIVQLFPGTWEKQPTDEGCINYVMRVSDFFYLRCFQGQPPPNCRVEEVEEIVPATVRKVKKLVCKEPPKEP